MKLIIPKRNWAPFLEDIGSRRAEWPARIEVDGKTIAAYGLEVGTRLDSISATNGTGGIVINVSVFGSSKAVLHRSIKDPVRIVYKVTQGKAGGVIEIEGFDGSRTRIYIDEPILPVVATGDELSNSQAVVV